MNRAQVIQIMTDAVEAESLNSAMKHDVPEDLAKATILAIRDETDRIHGIIYDALVDNGVL